MKTTKYILFIFIIGLLFVTTAVSAQPPKLPVLELRVQELDGEMTREKKTGEQLSVVAGDTIMVGEIVRLKNGSANLEIPGLSLLRMDSGTELSPLKMRRDTEIKEYVEDRVVYRREQIHNEIDIEAFRGRVINNLRSHENVETEYQIITPTAVAGIRGTTFRVEITPDRGTEVAVLDGLVNFYNRFDSARRREIGARQRSRIREKEADPDELEEIDPDDAEEIRGLQERARRDLQLRPVIEGLEVNGRAVQRRAEILYLQEEEISISGLAEAREVGAELTDIQVLVDGQPLAVEGLSEWKAGFIPDAIEEGENKEFTVQVVVEDNLGLQATLEFTLDIVRPQRRGEVREGNVTVRPLEIAGRSIDDVEFPLSIFSRSIVDGKINISGEAESSNAEIGGVAARISGTGNSLLNILNALSENEYQELITGSLDIADIVGRNEIFNLAEGTQQWEISVPVPESGEFAIEIIAWTDDNVLGAGHIIGPLIIASADQIPPENYELGPVNINYSRVGGIIADDARFPLHTFRGDLEDGAIVVEGTVEAASTVEAVAYSVDGGRNWQLANGSNQWWFAIPGNATADFDVRTVAWTVDGFIGRESRLGEIFYTHHSYEVELRNIFIDQWSAFERENSRDFISFVHDDFQFEDLYDNETWDRNELRKQLDDLFNNIRNIRVNHNIERTFANPSGGQLEARVEWRSQRDENQFTGKNLTRSSGIFRYERIANGLFKLITFDEFAPQEYMAIELELIHDNEMIQSWEPAWFHVTEHEVDFYPYYGQVFFALNENGPLGYETVTELPYVIIADGTSDYIEPEIANGGILSTGKTRFSDIDRIPSIGSDQYLSVQHLQKNQIYAMNFEFYEEYDDFSGYRSVTGLFKIVDFISDASEQPVRVKIQAIIPYNPEGEDPILDFRGVDLF